MKLIDIEYLITLREQEQVDQKIEDICIEQSIEMPLRVVSEQIKNKVVGRFKEKKQVGERAYHVIISWPYGNVGDEISHFLNILYGNISLQKGIRITGTDWQLLGKELFGGPAYGIETLRKQFGVSDRPLTATSIKPLGLTPGELGDLCYRFACGGIDLIKDDSGLANQDSAPFEERVEACVSALQRAADETGRKTHYFPHVTALAEVSVKRYRRAYELGADGALICPHIAGMETMHQLARMDVPLPIMAHPSFSGPLVTSDTEGLEPGFLYGELWRALGADLVVYTNAGGRFDLDEEACNSISRKARDPSLPFRRSFPMPGGGMALDTIGEWARRYGDDTVFLIGSALYDYPDGIETASALFRKKVESI